MKKLIVILMLVFSANLIAEVKIGRVSYNGDKPGSAIKLYHRRNIAFVPDSLSADSLKLTSYFQDRGWYDCRVEYEVRQKPERADINFRIVKNDLYRLTISDCEATFDDSLAEAVSRLISLYNGRPATSAVIMNLADDLIKFFSANGYPYCDVRFKDLVLEKPDRLIIKPDIQPGPNVIVGEIDFEGRKNLELSFLRKFVGLVPPMSFSAGRLAIAQKRLDRAEFISRADNYRLQYRDRPENGVIVFPIKEISPLVLDGAAGYSTQDQQFYGKFNATLSNILGKGRQVGIEWSKKDKSSRRLKVSFGEPYPLTLPFNLKIEVFQEDRDSVFIENSGSLGLRYLASDVYAYGVSAGLSRINPESYGRAFLPHKNKLRLSIEFAADTRDYPANARSGDYLKLAADFVAETSERDSLFAAATINYRTVELRLEKYLQLTNSSVLYGGLAARGDFSENVPADRLSPLGGFGSLRGYMQDQFFTSRQMLISAEYRLLTSKQGRAYIFADGALYQAPGPGDEGSTTKLETGFGIGIAGAVKMGAATVEIAAPSAGGLAETKLHFGLRTGF